MKIKLLTKFLIAILCITALLSSAYLVLAASTVSQKFTNVTISLPFGGFTTASGTVIPSGTLTPTVDGTLVLMPAPKLSGSQFTVTGHGTFTFTPDIGSITYTGVASFSITGTLNALSFQSVSHITGTAHLTAKGSDGSKFSFEIIFTAVTDANGVVRVNSVSTPNTSGFVPI